MKIQFGPGGIGTPPLEGLERIQKAKLDAAEIEFTYGVYMTNEVAQKIGDKARALGISLSIHAPYYINLASVDMKKRQDSRKRILDACERGHYLGARYIVLHAAFYGKMSAEECYVVVKEAIVKLQEEIAEKKWDVFLCPETTGKASQFGSVDELVRLSKETGCGICIDFAHVYARNIGSIDYDDVCKKIKAVKVLTAHFAGINYGPKGERNHELTPPGRMKELLQFLKKYDISLRIINESPDPVGDSIMARKLLAKV